MDRNIDIYHRTRQKLKENLQDKIGNTRDFEGTLNMYAYLASARMTRRGLPWEEIVMEYTRLALRDAGKRKRIEQRELSLIYKILEQRTGALLDIGAGWGRYLPVYQSLEIDPFYVDPVLLGPWLIRQKKISSAACAMGEHLPIKTHYFSTVVISQVLHHGFPDVHPGEILHESARVLIPGGMMISIESAGQSFPQSIWHQLVSETGFEIQSVDIISKEINLSGVNDCKSMLTALLLNAG